MKALGRRTLLKLTLTGISSGGKWGLGMSTIKAAYVFTNRCSHWEEDHGRSSKTGSQ